MVEAQPQGQGGGQACPGRSLIGAVCEQCAFVRSLLADSEEAESCYCYAPGSMQGTSEELADPLEMEDTYHRTAEPVASFECDFDYCSRGAPTSTDYEDALERDMRFGDGGSEHASEVTILRKDMRGISSEKMMESKNLLVRAFPAYFTAEPTLVQVLENIRETSNYEVRE